MPLILTTTTTPGAAGWSDGVTVGSATEYLGQVAQQNFLLGANPADGETYTLEVLGTPVVYTFRNSPSLATDVQIGIDAATTQASLATAIDTNQGTAVSVVDGGNPLPVYIALREIQATDETLSNRHIVQTDGTGGDITLRAPLPPATGNNKGGQRGYAPRTLLPVFLSREMGDSEVNDGQVIIPFTALAETGWVWWQYQAILMDGGSKGAGDAPTAVKAFTGTIETIFFPTTEVRMEITNGGATPYASGDVFVIWGFLSAAT